VASLLWRAGRWVASGNSAALGAQAGECVCTASLWAWSLCDVTPHAACLAYITTVLLAGTWAGAASSCSFLSCNRRHSRRSAAMPAVLVRRVPGRFAL
jgi:hypothetical protein